MAKRKKVEVQTVADLEKKLRGDVFRALETLGADVPEADRIEQREFAADWVFDQNHEHEKIAGSREALDDLIAKAVAEVLP